MSIMKGLNQVPGYESLTTEQQQLFKSVHAAHMNALGSQARENLGPPTSVAWHEEDECLHVHYRGTWYHYTPDGTWY